MSRKLQGLVKLAQYNYMPTVGDVMNRVNADMTYTPDEKKNFVTQVNSSGITVSQPASRLPYIVGGALAGNMLAKHLHAKPFWEGVYTLGAALYGNHEYNKANGLLNNKNRQLTRYW